MREKVLGNFDHAIFKLRTIGKVDASTSSLLSKRRVVVNTPKRAFKYSSILVPLLGWRAVRLFLDSCSRYLVDAKHHQLVKAYTARLIEQTYHSHMHGGKTSDELRKNFLDFTQTLNLRQRRFLTDDEDLIQLPYKRQPSLVESFDATITRFDFMKDFPQIRGVLQVFVGGSMAYGPFLNVRKGMASSDIDIVAVVGEDFLVNSDPPLSTDVGPFARYQWDSFYRRKAIFAKLFAEGGVDVFSHRFDVEEEGFKVSIHFFPLNIFNQVFGEDLKRMASDNKDIARAVKDFKPQVYEFKTCDRWNFSGGKHEYTLPPQREVEGGYIADMPAYMIKNRRFYPGFYHHIVMPSHIILNTDNNIRLDGFTQFMIKRVRIERNAWPQTSLLRSHPRRPIIAPGKFSKYE